MASGVERPLRVLFCGCQTRVAAKEDAVTGTWPDRHGIE
jgi:hypothetical protein